MKRKDLHSPNHPVDAVNGSNRIKRSVLLYSLALAFILPAAPAVRAQDKTGEIDKLFTWAGSSTPGCVCAVSQHGKPILNRAYGMADLEREVPLTPNSVFDAASLTKQFVAAAILLLVEEKRLDLSDDVRKYIPELHDYGHRITIDQLLTHTSGLRDWTGLGMLAASKTDALTMVLRQRGLDFIPGEEWSYSNSGYVLLKEIINRYSGMPFSEFARKRLFEPIGMKLTAYRNDLREVVKNRALGYEKENGQWKLDMALDNDRGGGGALLSTASDLLLWNEALTRGSLGNFVTQKLQEPARLNNGRKLGYARGLFLNTSRGGNVIGHTGGSGGYGSILTRIPAQGLSVAILCNSGSAANRMAAVRRILDLFLISEVPQTSTRKAAENTELNPSDLAGKAGLYFSEKGGDPLRLAINNGRLAIAGGPALVPLATDRFINPEEFLEFMSGDEFELRFLSQDAFELKSMEGKITRYNRAAAYTPSPEELKAFTGSYQNTEAGSVLRIEPKGEALLVVLEHSPEKKLEAKALAPGIFQAGRMTMRFQRDKAGKIIGFSYTNPVLRNLPFTRLKDGGEIMGK
ncbi:MAG TPA: serine hydrolase domain-containing protein [Flavisolibacter sp.]|nr:serine hydrolase domain-containing protein [Flavisolibacter sp.]